MLGNGKTLDFLMTISYLNISFAKKNYMENQKSLGELVTDKFRCNIKKGSLYKS